MFLLLLLFVFGVVVVDVVFVCCVHLAAALSGGLVAVRVEALADVTVTGSTHGAPPPATGARLLNPTENKNTRTIPLEPHLSSTRRWDLYPLEASNRGILHTELRTPLKHRNTSS